MDGTAKYKLFFYVLIVVLLMGWLKYKDLRRENFALLGEANECRDQVSEYQDSLSQANQNIEEANSYIEDAQSYTWSSYEDMGYALDNLQTVDTVSEPY